MTSKGNTVNSTNMNFEGLIPLEVSYVTKSIIAKGGRPMLIGGAVIDMIRLNIPKDWDIEVFNLTYEKLGDILESLGLTPNFVGKEFGIIKVTHLGYDLDLSIPRTENKIGVGHKGFKTTLCSSLTPKEAGERRDLTINSMYFDLSTYSLVDPFHGLKDLEDGRIKATNPETFKEDPLRVLRVMQLLARKGKFVESSTMELCRSMVDTFDTLSSERVFEEFNKLLLKSIKPSVGLNFLRESGWLIHFPELFNLVGCPQNPEWHPEGDVWNHTLMVVDNAATLRDRVPEEWRLSFMYGALLHDVGKPSTTKEDLTSNGHDKAGEPLASVFIKRLTRSKELRERVVAIVGNHMAPGSNVRGGAKVSAWRRLHNRIRLDIIGLISLADSCGRPKRNLKDPHPPSEVSFEFFNQFGETQIKPILMGRHLIERGLKPGREFKEILSKAYSIQIEEGIKDPEVLMDIVGAII